MSSDTTKVIRYDPLGHDVRMCAGLEMIVKGAMHENYVQIAPRHEYIAKSPEWREDLCEQHHKILQEYAKHGFRRKEEPKNDS